MSAVNVEVHHELADRHLARANRRAADQHHRNADRAEDERRKSRHRRDARQRLRDVAEQPVRALREHQLLALLRRVGLDDAHAAERLGEASRHFRVDLPALAEERPQPLESERHAGPERAQDDDRDRGQLPVQIDQYAEGEDRRENRPGELHQPGADQIPDAFGVGHDARDEHAGLGRVEVADRQPHHVGFDLLAHLGDGALRRDAEHLRERERRHQFDERRSAGGHREAREQLPFAPEHDVVHQELRGRREDQTGEPVDHHQGEADGQALPVLPDEPTRLLERPTRHLLLAFGRFARRRPRRGPRPAAALRTAKPLDLHLCHLRPVETRVGRLAPPVWAIILQPPVPAASAIRVGLAYSRSDA